MLFHDFFSFFYGGFMDISKLVKMAMLSRGMTAVQTGAKMGKSKNYISESLSRDNGMRIDTLQAIADALDYDVELSFVDRKTGKKINV